MESAQNGTTAYMSECRVDNIRYFVTTMIDRHNVLQWLFDSCKEQNKETTQSEMPITWGTMKDLKKIRKSLHSAYQKIVQWKKTISANPKRKSWKNTNCRSDSSYKTL